MRTWMTILLGLMLMNCSITDDGILIDFPSSTNVCINTASDDDVADMKMRIEKEPFKDDKLAVGYSLSKDRCFLARQVARLMDAFDFESSKLEFAKHLYHKTSDKGNFEVVIDTFKFSSDKEELRRYINSN